MGADYAENIKRLEELYRQLMGSDISTQQEVKAKAEIISLLPQLKAEILAEDTPEAKEIAKQVEALHDIVSRWNPLTAWFRDEESLVKTYFDLLSQIRLFFLRHRPPSDKTSTIVGESIESLRRAVTQLATTMEEIRIVVKTILEIISPTPELHARIAGLSSRALELERRIADLEASNTPKTAADKAKIQRWKQNLQKLTDQIATLRKIAQRRRG